MSMAVGAGLGGGLCAKDVSVCTSQGAHRPQTRRADSPSPFSHTALSHSGGLMGFFRIFFFFSHWLSLWLTAIYIDWHWVNWKPAERGGHQANWLSYSWSMAGFRRKCRPATCYFSSAYSLETMDLEELFWQGCMNCCRKFSLCLFLSHAHVDVWLWLNTTLGVGIFLCCYKYCLHAAKPKIRIRWSQGGLLNKAFQ